MKTKYLPLKRNASRLFITERAVFEILELPKLESLTEYFISDQTLREMFFWHFKNVLDHKLSELEVK